MKTVYLIENRWAYSISTILPLISMKVDTYIFVAFNELRVGLFNHISITCERAIIFIKSLEEFKTFFFDLYENPTVAKVKGFYKSERDPRKQIPHDQTHSFNTHFKIMTICTNLQQTTNWGVKSYWA